jgi:cell division protein FtsL
MARLNLVLMLVAVVFASLVVASNHKARKLYNELEREQERMRQLEVEWGQLQIESSTLAAHGRIEKIAREKLHMRQSAPGSVVAVTPVQEAKSEVRP